MRSNRKRRQKRRFLDLWMHFFFGFCVAFFIVGTLRPWPSSRVVEEYLLPLPPHQLAMLHLQPKRLPWLLELRLDGGWWMMLDGGGGQVLLF